MRPITCLGLTDAAGNSEFFNVRFGPHVVATDNVQVGVKLIRRSPLPNRRAVRLC